MFAYNSFLGPTFDDVLPGIPQPEESYIFDPYLFTDNNMSMQELKQIVDSIKPSGVRVYYRVDGAEEGTGYILVP